LQYRPVHHKRRPIAGCRWPTPVILATKEGEIRKITVQSQPWQIVPRYPISKNLHKKRADGVAQGVGPEFKLQDHKKKKGDLSKITKAVKP
jgi:hypothetical protein